VNISQSVARVYAKALFDIGTQGGNLGEIFDDLHGIQAAADATPEEQASFERARFVSEFFGGTPRTGVHE